MLLDALPAAVYLCDPDGLITYYNRNAEQLWGRAPRLNDPADRFCGSFRLFAADGTAIPHDRCWMALALRDGRQYSNEEILVERPSGERLTVLANASPIHDAAGELLGGFNVLVDISDRQRADVAKAVTAAIVESSDDAIISKTLDGQIQSWNPAAERLFGYAAAEAIGRPITMIIPPDRQDEERMILSRLQAGERIEHYETVRLAKDGRPIDISLTTSPVRDRSGRVVGASKVARDITGRKQAEHALLAVRDELATQLSDLRRLQELSIRLSTTLELTPILNETIRAAVAADGTDMGLLSLWDEQKGVLQISASVGLSEESLCALDRVPTAGSARGKCFERRQRVIIEDIEAEPVSADFREAAHQIGVRAVHCTPLITRSGKIIGVLSTHFRRAHRPPDRKMRLADLYARQAVDFIENARLYQQLRDADRAKNEFLAVLAHELRNPLAPIRSAAEVVRLSAGRTAEAVSALEIIDRQINQMTRLVDDLLDIARITENKLALRKQRIVLEDVLRSAAEASRPMIDANRLELEVTLPPEPIALDGDLARLSQVISNLLNNAAKFTDAGGHVWLTAARQGSDAVVTVRDDGIGISPEMLPRVFEMFAQAESRANRPQAGLGIGLTLVKRLVELHGGSVRAASDGLGKGSEFIVRLPLAVDASGVGPRSRADRDAADLRASLRILVVDDNADAADSLAMLLRMMGSEVRVAYDGPTALSIAHELRPDVALVDIGLPGISGHVVARTMRAAPWGRALLLIATTGWSQSEDRERSKQAGFDHHLVKPIDPAALMRLLARVEPGADSPARG
jgi:PAS domain S-box-containing protein